MLLPILAVAYAPAGAVLINVSNDHAAAFLAQTDGARQPNALPPSCEQAPGTLMPPQPISDRKHNCGTQLHVARAICLVALQGLLIKEFSTFLQVMSPRQIKVWHDTNL